MHPSEARQLFRQLDKPTSGMCPGYLQANLVILPAAYAAAFESFCRINCRPCPLLYRSQPGEYAAPPLAKDSDVRDQLPAYFVYEHGVKTARVTDIHSLWQEDSVCFYLGCSFSFENALVSASVPVRNAEQGKNVSMYLTNRECEPVPPFSARMVVSMRPIPPNLVAVAQDVTAPHVLAHGGPVHCGDPAALGIQDIGRPDFGEAVDFQPNDIPCFWACGVTAIVAAASATVVPRLITHAPGHMFITDIHESEPLPKPVYSTVTQGYSLRCMEAINRMETLIREDPGQRGIAALARCTELWRASLDLYKANTVVLTTGFPCAMQYNPATESDGPSGTLALARALVLLGKKVILTVEECNMQVMQATCKAAANACPSMASGCTLVEYSTNANAQEFLDQHKPDVLVAIERAGRSPSGKYLTMRAREMQGIAPVDDLFELANKTDLCTIGVGDGGNELGMGKVGQHVARAINLGEQIRAVVAARHVIVTGVSNWGGYALAAALAALHRDAGTGSSPTESLLLDAATEEAVLRAGFEAGMHDGVKPEQEMSVDGLTFRPVHAEVLEKLHAILAIV